MIEHADMLGLLAGAVTSMGFVPQLIRGFTTKKLDDVSYFMPVILAVGMSMWLAYGLLIESFSVVVANGFGIGCCLLLISMKKLYSLQHTL